MIEFARFEFGGQYELGLLDLATGVIEVGRPILPALLLTREAAEESRRRKNPFQPAGTEIVVLKVET